jgi:hypothetical protein
MDGEDGVILVQSAGKEIPEFEAFEFFLKLVQISFELLEEELAALFLKDPDGFLQIKQSVFQGLKGRHDIFKSGFFLEKFFGLLGGGPDLFLMEVTVDFFYGFPFPAYIKDNLLGPLCGPGEI